MKVIFFNHFHNGDLHVSRGFVIKIINKVLELNPSSSFVYSHKNDPCLLSDIKHLSFDVNEVNIVRQEDNLVKFDGGVYINTWYAQQEGKYTDKYGTTMDSLYAAFDDTCKELWKFSLSDISEDVSDFFPIIDYSKFEIEHSALWLSIHPEKKIFVANGHAKSGQATNFNMTNIIIKLSEKHLDTTFILSNKECDMVLPINVIYSSDIIKKTSSSDLNENSFISSYCDVIIGRSSGASTYAITQDSLFRKPTKILYFSKMHLPPEKFWVDALLKDKVNFSADILCTAEEDENNVLNIIETNII